MISHPNTAPVATDPLFLALTRPPMAFGVTYTFFVINGMIALIAFLATNSFLAPLVGIPVHVIGYLACLKDPHMFELWRVAAKTGRAPNHHHWKANSYQP